MQTVPGVVVPDWQPAAGPHRPVQSSMPRRPGSVRRTTTTDTLFPGDDMTGSTVVLRGRDLATNDAGDAAVVDALDLRLRAGMWPGLVEWVDGPDAGAWEGLVGVDVRAGFGRRLADSFPTQAAARPLVFSVLDDLPGAYLVAGYSLLRLGLLPNDIETSADRAALQADVCAGWATGGPLLGGLLEHGRSAVPYGPVAPALEADDLDGWHEFPPLDLHTVRRRRLLDVAAGPDGYSVHSHFRDSYAAADHEMVMHEYVVDASIDRSLRITSIAVEDRVLPWAECPSAVASAQSVVGTDLAELGARVRSELRGTVGCTHLSSTVRALADVESLVGHVGDGDGR